jgi:hypothetical protein
VLRGTNGIDRGPEVGELELKRADLAFEPRGASDLPVGVIVLRLDV